jgi:hypothetical protein
MLQRTKDPSFAGAVSPPMNDHDCFTYTCLHYTSATYHVHVCRTGCFSVRTIIPCSVHTLVSYRDRHGRNS